MIVVPSRSRSICRYCHTSRRAAGSRPVLGSSRMSRGGPVQQRLRELGAPLEPARQPADQVAPAVVEAHAHQDVADPRGQGGAVQPVQMALVAS